MRLLQGLRLRAAKNMHHFAAVSVLRLRFVKSGSDDAASIWGFVVLPTGVCTAEQLRHVENVVFPLSTKPVTVGVLRKLAKLEPNRLACGLTGDSRG